jgi:hypothetical protein
MPNVRVALTASGRRPRPGNVRDAQSHETFGRMIFIFIQNGTG